MRVWHAELGWGVLSSPEVPGEVFAHFSAIDVPGSGFRELAEGDSVEFEYRPVPDQDGYHFVADRVRQVR